MKVAFSLVRDGNWKRSPTARCEELGHLPLGASNLSSPEQHGTPKEALLRLVAIEGLTAHLVARHTTAGA